MPFIKPNMKGWIPNSKIAKKWDYSYCLLIFHRKALKYFMEDFSGFGYFWTCYIFRIMGLIKNNY